MLQPIAGGKEIKKERTRMWERWEEDEGIHCHLLVRSIDNPLTAARFIVYLLLNSPLLIFRFATNTNIVIGNREQSSVCMAIILPPGRPISDKSVLHTSSGWKET